jgi:hypothetical protein
MAKPKVIQQNSSSIAIPQTDGKNDGMEALMGIVMKWNSGIIDILQPEVLAYRRTEKDGI